MRLAFYTDTYFPNTDGVVSQILAIKKELESKGHSVHVFTSGSTEEKKAADSTVSVYPSVKLPSYPQYKFAVFPYTSVSTVKKLHLELVHCHALASMGFASVYAAKTLNLPLIGTFHTMAPLATHYLVRNRAAQEVLSSALWRGIKVFYKPFDVVTAPSRVVAKLLQVHGVENVKVISNGIDLKQFNPKVEGRAEIRRRLKVKKGEKLFTFIGRVTQEKNLSVLLQSAKLAAGENQDFKLAIVGGGPALKEIKAMARELKLRNVVFTGLVSHDEIPAFLAATDWQISASTFETQGIGIIEGLSCGKPCIGADSLAIPEAVKEGKNGFLFKPFDVAECAEEMLNALSLGEKKYRQLSRYSSSHAAKYSIEKTTGDWVRLYRRFI